MAIKIYQSKYTGEQIDAQLDKVDTKVYTLEEPQGSSWVRIAKLPDPKTISKGLVSLKSSGIRLDTYYDPIKDFTPETVLSAGTSYRFKVDYDYTDHIDIINGQGLNLKITAGGSEAEITENCSATDFWVNVETISNWVEEPNLGRITSTCYDTTKKYYLDGNATLVFTCGNNIGPQLFMTQDNEDEVKNNLENYNKVSVYPGQSVNFDLEDQDETVFVYIYSTNRLDLSPGYGYTCKIVGGRGRTTTNYVTITPETDVQVKDILVQANLETFDYFVTSLEQVRVEEVPVNFPYVQFKAVYDPLTNHADVNPILVSSGHAGITDISWGGSGNGDNYSSDSGSDMSSYSEASEVSQNQVDLTETGEEETTEETIDPISFDEVALTSDSEYSSGSEYTDSGSGSGANIYDFGFKAATFECYDGQVYLDVLLHHPATNNYKDFNLTSTLEEAENLELLEEIVPHDLEAVLNKQLLEGSTFEKGINYEFVISANYQDYIDAISQNKEINITYTPTTVDGEDLDPVTILKYNSAELIVLDSATDSNGDSYLTGAEYPDHIISSTGYNQWSARTSLQTYFASKTGYVYYTKLAGTAEITFSSSDAYKDVTAEDIQAYFGENFSVKFISYEVLESSEDRSSIKFSFKLEGCFLDFKIGWFLAPMYATASASTLTIDPTETEFCLKLPFTPKETVVFDRYSIDNNDAYNFQLRISNILKSQTCEDFDLYSPQAVVRALDRSVSELNNNIISINSDISSLNNKINDQASFDQASFDFDKTLYNGITKTGIDLRDHFLGAAHETFDALYEFITSKQGLVRACCVDEDGNIVAYDLVAENNEIKFNKYETWYHFYWSKYNANYISIGGNIPVYCYLSYEGTDPELLDFFGVTIPLHYNSPITKDLQENKQDKILSTPNITVNTSANFVIPNVDTLFTEDNYHEAPALFTFNSNLYFMQLNVDTSSCLTFSSNKAFSLTPTENLIYDGTIEYFAADVSDWTPVQAGISIKSINNKIYLRGKGNTYCKHSISLNIYSSTYDYHHIPTTCFNLIGTDVSCDGNIETLLDWESVKVGNHPTMGDFCFKGLFNKCNALIKAPVLPATTLSYGCYFAMFSHCSLTQAPELPALEMTDMCYAGMFANTPINIAPVLASTELASRCYFGMFDGCLRLTQAPELPATDLASGCYARMFHDCSRLTAAPELPAMKVPEDAYYSMFTGCLRLTQAPELPATDLGSDCYRYMLCGCSSLTQAPALPAMKVPQGAYEHMFDGCSSLTQAPELPATDLDKYCYRWMFDDCSNLTKAPTILPAMKVPEDAYNGMFSDCSSLTQAPELPATDLGSSCYMYMFSGCSSLTQAPELPAMKVPEEAYDTMFNRCPLVHFPAIKATTFGLSALENMFETVNIKLATTPTEEYPYEFRIPWGTATATIIDDAGNISSDINPGSSDYPLDGIDVIDTTTGDRIPAALNTTYYANIPTIE